MLPNASAGASFHVESISGAFHGLMATTTPAAGYSTYDSRPSLL